MSASEKQHAPGEMAAQLALIKRRDIAAEAYADALQYLQREFQGNTKALAWLSVVRSTSLSDVLATTKQVESKYNEVSQNKHSIRAWLEGLSKRIMYYGQVLDVLSQHHPEYVALVWGLVKFVLMGILNHGTLVAQFSQALSMIAQVLPRTELSAELYQSNEMKDAVAHLYAHILLFLQQAVRWYHAGPASRALTALFKPFELSYKESIEQIMLCAQQIDDISSIASKVEIREIKVLVEGESAKLAKQEAKLHEMQVQFNLAHEELVAKVGSILQIISCSASRLNEVHLDIKDIKPRVGDMHFSHVLGALRPKRSPEDALRAHRSLIRRSSPWRSQSNDTLALLQSVGQWISAPNSSLLVLQTQPRAQARVKEIATELIALLQPRPNKVIWYLSSLNVDNEGEISSVEVLKSLIFQCMKLVPEFVASDPGNFSTAKLQGCHSDEEWLELLCHILRYLNACFIVIEAEDVFTNKDEATQLLKLVESLAAQFQDVGHSIKILLVNYSTSWNDSNAEGLQGRVLTVNREAPVPPRRRRPGARSPFRGAAWGGMGGIK
ncbi:hypothetical protein B0I35DRAFT_442378 [Stachybotrys elegans]|uniref:DUF7708 domain-containing protein n=1 Tax=Stachybotrys elegans TaxID=80388 RepID=A0A8K0WL78_9HYPO|nr:hypothetical protein B0I35DRAFT_442378 [Stachybotrys elegans]